MGRRAKPTHLKLIENARDRRPSALRAGEPLPVEGILEPPNWLTDVQRLIWDHALASMPHGLLKPMDLDLFVSWVLAVDIRNQTAQKLAHSTLLVKGSKNGSVEISPLLKILNQQTVILKALAAEFGFSPAARTGIAMIDEPESDPTDKYFQ